MTLEQRQMYRNISPAEKEVFINLNPDMRQAFVSMNPAERNVFITIPRLGTGRTSFIAMDRPTRAAYIGMSDPHRNVFITLSPESQALFHAMPNPERNAFIQLSTDERKRFIQQALVNKFRLAAVEEEELISVLYDQRFHENHFSPIRIERADLSNNPHRSLLKILWSIQRHNTFPSCNYGGREADAGGVTRNFMTQLFEALCHDKQQTLPLLSSDGKYIPTMLDIDALSAEEASPRDFGKLCKERQIQCYQGIGEIFAKTLYGQEDYSLTTGAHFHESTFAMMHALTEADLNDIPADFNLHRMNAERRDSLIKKLTIIFLKTNYTNLFSDDEGIFIGDAAFSQEATDLVEGRISDRLRAKNIDEEARSDLLKASRDTIDAIIIITKSIHTRLRQRIHAGDPAGNRWDTIKGADAKVLGEKIEGKLTQEMVLAAFRLQRDDDHLNQQEQFIKRWINEASFEDLEKFVWATTGSKTLPSNQTLTLRIARYSSLDHLPIFHTCTKSIDCPAYTSYDMCKERLRAALDNLGDSFELR